MVEKTKKLDALRVNYTKDQLLEQNIGSDPVKLFEVWMEEAKKSSILEPNAMVLSTVRDGKPTGRVVLLKIVDQKGFVFFTNYESHKGMELQQNPFAALTFFWDALEKQVRIEGHIEKVSEDISSAYFHSRPRESQIGAWVSRQSAKVEDRATLEEMNVFYTNKFKELAIIPRPGNWGGYIVIPDRIEFWQGRQDRLHDRILYLKKDQDWNTERLSP